MSQASIRIEIGSLLLEGFPADQHEAIRVAMEQELARLAGEHGWQGGAPATSRVDAGHFELAPGTPADQIGSEVARQVFQRLNSEPRPR